MVCRNTANASYLIWVCYLCKISWNYHQPFDYFIKKIWWSQTELFSVTQTCGLYQYSLWAMFILLSFLCTCVTVCPLNTHTPLLYNMFVLHLGFKCWVMVPIDGWLNCQINCIYCTESIMCVCKYFVLEIASNITQERH